MLRPHLQPNTRPSSHYTLRYYFSGIPNLAAIDLSRNILLYSLGPNLFDGAFQTSPTSRPRLILIDSHLTSISKRAFNFDGHGLSSTTVITISTAADSSGLNTCCGTEWLTIDRHFATRDLTCVNTLGVSVSVQSTSATPYCCVADADVEGMEQLRTHASDPAITSYVSLNTTARAHVARLCRNADWIVSGGVVRSCGTSCVEDTFPGPPLLQVLQPGASTCTSGESSCPTGWVTAPRRCARGGLGLPFVARWSLTRQPALCSTSMQVPHRTVGSASTPRVRTMGALNATTVRHPALCWRVGMRVLRRSRMFAMRRKLSTVRRMRL